MTDDPLVLKAREIVKATLKPENHTRCLCREQIDAGQWDDYHAFRAAMVALQEKAK